MRGISYVGAHEGVSYVEAHEVVSCGGPWVGV